jgi:hypothetical protein
MLSIIRRSLALAALLAAWADAAGAQTYIQSAHPDETLRTLTIRGAGFGLLPPPEVWLNLTPVVLISNTPTELVVELPPIPVAASYLLRVTQGAATAVFYVGLGEAGRPTAPTQGTATASAAYASDPLLLGASTFNTTTQAEERQTFRWRAEPVANNTDDPGGRLRLAFGANGATGALQFAAGQSIPGAVTGLVAGNGIAITGTAAAPTVNIAAGGVTSAMIASGAVTGSDILNGQVAVTDLAVNPATQTELAAHEHDSRYFSRMVAEALLPNVYTQLVYTAAVGIGESTIPLWWPYLTVGSFTKTRTDSNILLLWNGSVRVDKNDHKIEPDACGYQLRIDDEPAPNDAGQTWSFIKDQSVPINLSASFEGLGLGGHTVSIWVRPNGPHGYPWDLPEACEINPASIPESVIVVESGR